VALCPRLTPFREEDAVTLLLAVLALTLPSDRPVETALKTYCERERLDRARLEQCQLDLIPGTVVFRYRLPAIQVAGTTRPELRERYAVVFVEVRTGRLLELKRMQDDGEHRKFYGPLFAEMKRAGRKVTTNKEAAAVLCRMMTLENWLRYGQLARDVAGVEVNGSYRGRPNTFGAGCYPWFSGDDLGLEVDAEGYPVGLLGGHIR
jgi:hypothetical protein